MTSEQRGAEPSLHDFLVRNVGRFALMLVVMSPALCGVALLTGEASLASVLRYEAVVEPAFVAIWLATRWRVAQRWPEWLQFALTFVAAYGVIFSPTHDRLAYKPYAMLAPMCSFIFAVVSPTQPWMAYLLASGTAIMYALAVELRPDPTAASPLAYAVMCFSMAWMGAAFARSQRALWDQLEEARRQALDATRLKSEFLANMSHEIRTPMTAILGFAEEVELGLGNAPGGAALHGMLATIRRNGTHLLSLINGILDLSKVEAGKLEAVREPCAPLAIVAEVSGLLRAQALERGLSFVTVVTGPVPESFASDRTHLRQILINLVGNALKFTERGGVRIEIGLAPERAGAPRELEISVVDSGCGIAPDQLPRLFESFTQVHGSLTREHQGTGLGLALSRRLARLLDGDIEVSSQPGVGSRFRLHLPLGPDHGSHMLSAAEATALAENEAAPAREPSSRMLGGRVLLVEDGPDNQRLITSVLRRAGLQVEIAADGERGCELALGADAAGEPYDVILMDMQMPVLDGYAAVQRLRGRGYRGAIIALTANVMGADRERSLAIGCNDHATKPIERDHLLRQIEAQLGKSALA